MDHAVDVVLGDEQTELGLVLDLACSTSEPTGCFSAKASHGSNQLSPANAALHLIDLEITTSTSEVEMILPGWTFFFVQDISETWIRPSMPGSSSTNAP